MSSDNEASCAGSTFLKGVGGATASSKLEASNIPIKKLECKQDWGSDVKPSEISNTKLCGFIFHGDLSSTSKCLRTHTYHVSHMGNMYYVIFHSFRLNKTETFCEIHGVFIKKLEL